MSENIIEKEIPSQKPYYIMTIGGMILAIILLFMGFVVSGLMQFVTQKMGESFIQNWVSPVMFALPFIFAIAVYYFLFLKPKNLHYNFGFSLSNALLYPPMILMFLGLMLISEPIANSIPTSGLNGFLDTLWNEMIKMEKYLRKYPYAYSFMIAILAPIFEELFFRGLLLKGLLNNKKLSPYLSIFITAFIFAFIHMNPWQFVGALILGYALGVVYYKTQSLLNCMLLHFFNNALGLVVFFSVDSMQFSAMMENTDTESIITGLILFSIFGYLFYKMTKNRVWKYY